MGLFNMKILWRSLKWDIFIGASATVLLVINTFKAQFYIAGIFNMGYMWYTLAAWYWLAFIAVFFCIVVMILHLMLKWRSLDLRSRFILSIIIIGLIGGMILSYVSDPFAVSYLSGLRLGILVEEKLRGTQCKSFECEVYAVEWGLEASPHPIETPKPFYEGYYTLRVNDRAYVWLRELK